MKKAFTLIELVVAIGILGMMFLFSGVIFRTGIETHRTAGANAEIMQKLRAITDQLNRDFKGIREGFPIVVFANPGRIVFLASGDFHSIMQYGTPGNEKIVRGNIASIFYGPDANNVNLVDRPEEKILLRGQMILTADDSLSDSNAFTLDEYYKMSFYEFKLASRDIFTTLANWAGASLPPLDITSQQDLVKYMAKGVDEFTVSWAQWDNIAGKFAWISGTAGGVFVDDVHALQRDHRPGARALMFSFRLYDSKEILENGRKFTHIVYIGD